MSVDKAQKLYLVRSALEGMACRLAVVQHVGVRTQDARCHAAGLRQPVDGGLAAVEHADCHALDLVLSDAPVPHTVRVRADVDDAMCVRVAARALRTINVPGCVRGPAACRPG